MIESVVPDFNSIAEVRQAQFCKENLLPANLYPRDGYEKLLELEQRVSSLVGVSAENLLLYSSGMSAIVDALEVTNPTQGTTILYGEELYNQSHFYLQELLAKRGVKVVPVDSGSIEDIEQAASKYNPKVIFLETVANGPDMPVLDVEGLVESSVLARQKPLIILDNTLPTPTNLPPGSILSSHDNILALESGTKFYARNHELCGITYAREIELLDSLKLRRRIGSGLSFSAAKVLEVTLLPRDKFHSRNKRILSNSFTLAKACFSVDNGQFFTVYPNLPNHPNFEYAYFNSPEGLAPLFFIQLPLAGKLDQFSLTEKLWQNSAVKRYYQLGQSFGFDHTRIWPDPNYPAIRISAGTEGDEEIQELAEAFKNTLKEVNEK